MILARIAWREIARNRRFAGFFALNLALGLFLLLCLDSMKGAIDRSLDAKSRLLLSADLAISARRPLTEKEHRALSELLPPGAREERMIGMFSMVASGRSSRLADVEAIDDSYPLYGSLTLRSRGKIRSSAPPASSAWIDPDLALELGVKPGQSIRIGEASFRVDDLIIDDTGAVWKGFSPATTLYIGLSSLPATRLIRKGSLAYYSRLFALPRGTDLSALARRIDRALPDPAIQVRTHRDASDEVGRLLHYLTDYLGLVALVALFLSAIGSGFLFREFLSRRTREIAILASLGAGRRVSAGVYLCVLGILGAVAAFAASAAAELALPLAARIANPYLPFPIAPALAPRTIGLAFLLGIAGSVLICLPLLLKIGELRPAELFSESASPGTGLSARQLAGAAPGLLVFAALSVWQAHSVRVGGLFLACFVGSALALAALGLGGLALAGRWERRAGFRLATALRQLRRNRLSTASCFVAIGAGTLLLNVIPSVERSLQTELAQPSRERRPGLFLFDIQEEQIGPIESYLRGEGLAFSRVSPLVRARLIRVNGKPFEKQGGAGGFQTREEEQEARAHNRGFNLSYPEPGSTEGGFDGAYDPSSGKPAEVSLERRFARRMKMGLGDRLEFDVEGVPVRGLVTSLRTVHWTSFQPGFFILLQPGVLESAPKTFLASLPELGPRLKLEVQNGIVARFPNVSVIDVAGIVSKILEMFRQMSVALDVMAYLTLAAGFAVLFSIAGSQASTRRREANLLKVLGARFGDVRAIVACELAILGLGASVLGCALSDPVAALVTSQLFDGGWEPAWKVQAASVALVTLVSAACALLAARGTLRGRPSLLLSEAEP